MFDIDTLNALYEPTADTLYPMEVAQLPKLSRQEEEELVALARAGDQQARQAFVESGLAYALSLARRFHNRRSLQHDDPLDLAQEASLKMIEGLDEALATSRPAAYLRGIAERAISRYCTYHAGLIQMPQYSLAELAKYQHPATSGGVESLDTLIYGKHIHVDLLSAPEPQPESDERRHRVRYAILYQALKRLSRKQRSTIIQLYGLYGQPTRKAKEIGDGNVNAINATASIARKRLHKYLEEHLARMLAPKPELGEV